MQSIFKKQSLGMLALLIAAVLMTGLNTAKADARSDIKNSMKESQLAMSDAFNKLDYRVKGINANDPKKKPAQTLLGQTQKAVDAFKGLNPDEHITGEDPFFKADAVFEKAQQEALTAINNVNRFLISPFRPGDTVDGVEGTVPEGKLLEDFVPQVIRQLFRFTSIAILITIIVSAVMMIGSMDNEERVTKARGMLIYALLGFGIVVLAFAVVKAVTNIDFFGFI